MAEHFRLSARVQAEIRSAREAIADSYNKLWKSAQEAAPAAAAEQEIGTQDGSVQPVEE